MTWMWLRLLPLSNNNRGAPRLGTDLESFHYSNTNDDETVGSKDDSDGGGTGLQPETQEYDSIDLQGATGLQHETQDEGSVDLQDVVMEDTQKDKAVVKGATKRITYLQLSKLANELVTCATKSTEPVLTAVHACVTLPTNLQCAWARH
jgi:hypothetical protein